jgi:hypothetical protein
MLLGEWRTFFCALHYLHGYGEIDSFNPVGWLIPAGFVEALFAHKVEGSPRLDHFKRDPFPTIFSGTNGAAIKERVQKTFCIMF